MEKLKGKLSIPREFSFSKIEQFSTDLGKERSVEEKRAFFNSEYDLFLCTKNFLWPKTLDRQKLARKWLNDQKWFVMKIEKLIISNAS